MLRRNWLTFVVVLFAWFLFAAWQLHEYRQDKQAVRESLEQQAETIGKTLAAGIRSHRRLGRFFQDQVQIVLDELVAADEVLAVSTVRMPDQGEGGPELIAQAGRAEFLSSAPVAEHAVDWLAAGLQLQLAFELRPDTGGGPGHGGGMGPWGAQRQEGAGQAAGAPFAKGGVFVAQLLLDRTATDEHMRRDAWLRGLVMVVGTVALLLIAVAWHTSVRLVEVQSRQRLLESESGHWRDLSQAAAGLAHETRNPIGLIRGWAQRLCESNGNAAQQRQKVRALVEECDRVTARINQFLAYARPCEPNVTSLSLETLLDELTVLLEPDLGTNRLSVEKAGVCVAEEVFADPDLLRQVLFNLLQNAIWFAPEGSTITIGLACRKDGTVRIDVADCGPGVAEETVDRLFTPYFTTRAAGTGLGLAIVRRIVLAHGWDVGYETRPGGGSIFFVAGIRARCQVET